MRERTTRSPVRIAGAGICCLDHLVVAPQAGWGDTAHVARYDAQGGGINVSPRFDAAAKGMGQLLLDMPIKVSAAIAQQLN